MPNSIESILTCLNLVHCLQNERGLVTLFLCSRGARGKDDLASAFSMTDLAFDRLRETDFVTDSFFETLPRLLAALSHQRYEVSELIAQPGDIVAWYTDYLAVPALDLLDNRVLHDNRYLPQRASAFVYLLQWQERLGHEREMVTQLAGQEWFHDDAFVGRLKKVIRERQTYERLFWGVADEKQLQACAALKKSLQDGRALAGNDGVARQDKFTFFCTKIDALYEAAKKIADLLFEDKPDYFAAASSTQPLDGEVESYFAIIRALPLFRGVKHDVLREMLRPARLAHHDKNSLILTQGEIASRFFVILDGLVNVFKSTADGEESILQILGKRDCLTEGACLVVQPCAVNARTINKTKLLSLPSSMMRDYVAQNKELALNLLASSTRRSHRLMTHLEQLTLRSAKQRVGGFLLSLNLETGIGGPPLVLPFDKSLIAAYLGIKPETFSRVLQEFRDQGFKIDRQQITLPEPHALCSFCESETAAKCDLAETNSCPKAEFYKVKFALD